MTSIIHFCLSFASDWAAQSLAMETYFRPYVGVHTLSPGVNQHLSPPRHSVSPSPVPKAKSVFLNESDQRAMSDDEGRWSDVTSLLSAAAGEMELGQMVHGSSFVLYEAMSALELMDPKMDAGMKANNVPSVAARLESATKRYGVNILMSQYFYDKLSPACKEGTRRIDVVCLKGSSIPMEIPPSVA